MRGGTHLPDQGHAPFVGSFSSLPDQWCFFQKARHEIQPLGFLKNDLCPVNGGD
jgi:hypothetical protein